MTSILLLNANSLSIPLADKSVNCVVTSPPYWGLRDYNVTGQLGLEPTPQEYVANMVQVFREVWRVLADAGVVWLNLGDSYNGAAPNRTGANGYNDGRENRDKCFSVGGVDGLKPKDLCGIPWRVAFALQDDGWYLRSDCIWSKPNPMPESVTDRPTKAHEYVFLLTKRERYYYDNEAVREPYTNIERDSTERAISGFRVAPPGGTTHSALGKSRSEFYKNAGRNRRTVWTIPTQPVSFAHFATMPEALVEPCIKAGCPAGGIVLDPFAGSGTVGIVARRLNRHAVLCDLSLPYLRDIARERLGLNALAAWSEGAKVQDNVLGGLPLFEGVQS